MGHATHFLQRLDRVSDGHVELALTLYQDQELLREVLSRAAVPDGAERLAISLDDPVEGPFVVVTREGRFVTCLAAGMLVSDLPIVTRERLDSAAARVGRMREELDRVRELRASGADGQAALVFRRMQQQGPRFAREDAERLLQVQPLIEDDCLRRLRALLGHLGEEESLRLASFQLDPRKMVRQQREYLLAFGDAVWSVAHLLVFIGSSSMRRSFQVAEEELGSSAANALALCIFQWGTFTHAARAMWFVARGGKRALATVKAMTADGELSDRVYREMALTAIGLGSEKLRAEAKKALCAHTVPEPDPSDPVRTAVAHFGARGHGVLSDPAGYEASYLQVSRAYAARVLARREEVTAEECAAIPEDIARIALVTSQGSFHRPESLPLLHCAMPGLPSLVRASPAELFPPAAWAARLLRPRSLEDVLLWFRPYAEARRLVAPRREPVRASAAPGRNDPCRCGSGKKYKRCCAGA